MQCRLLPVTNQIKVIHLLENCLQKWIISIDNPSSTRTDFFPCDSPNSPVKFLSFIPIKTQPQKTKDRVCRFIKQLSLLLRTVRLLGVHNIIHIQFKPARGWLYKMSCPASHDSHSHNKWLCVHHRLNPPQIWMDSSVSRGPTVATALDQNRVEADNY